MAKIIARRHFKITVFASQLYFTFNCKVYNDILLLIMLHNNVVQSTVANFSHKNL